MSQLDKQQEQRRKVISMLGAGAVALPVLGLSACGGDSGPGAESAAAPASTGDSMNKAMDTAKDATASMAEKAQSTMDSAEESVEEAMNSAEAAVDEAADDATMIAKESSDSMSRVDENGPQATGLSYRHDATTVDASVQTRYAAGQQCSNCILYQGGSAEWGGCPLFAGKQVKATGWCSAYSAAG